MRHPAGVPTAGALGCGWGGGGFGVGVRWAAAPMEDKGSVGRGEQQRSSTRTPGLQHAQRARMELQGTQAMQRCAPGAAPSIWGGGFEGSRGGVWGSFRCLCFKLKEGDGLVKLTGCREHHWFSQCFACAAASWEPPLPQCRRSASSTASTLQGFPAGNERLRSFRVPSQLLTPAGGDRSKVSGCFIPDRRERSAARLRPPASSPQPEPPGGQQ